MDLNASLNSRLVTKTGKTIGCSVTKEDYNNRGFFVNQMMDVFLLNRDFVPPWWNGNDLRPIIQKSLRAHPDEKRAKAGSHRF